MENFLNSALYGVKRSAIRVYSQMAKNTPGCISLTLGEPDFDTPENIRNAAKASLDAGDTHYIANNGNYHLLQAISAFEKEKNGMDYFLVDKLSVDDIIKKFKGIEKLAK